MSQGQLIAANITRIGLMAYIGADAKLHVMTQLAVGAEDAEYEHSTYSICTNDELETVMDAMLGVLFVRAFARACGKP